MAAHSESFPHAPSPFRRATRPSIPGRGAFSSVMLALGTITLLMLGGVFIVLTYLAAVEDAPREAAEDGFVSHPLVNLDE
jgi:hypothetical protein